MALNDQNSRAASAAAAPVYWSSDGERFDCDSLSDLIDQMDAPKIGDIVYFGNGVRPDPARLCHADDVIDTMAARAYDEAGEAAEDYPDVSDGARAELNALLVAWIEKHCTPDFWRIENVQEYTLTAGGIDAELAAGAQP